MGSTSLPIYQVDAFTREAFAGNPAAVCLLPHSALPLSDALRQRIASEMNLSETAFLECLDHGGAAAEDFQRCSRFRLRWFTPTVEVPLCGHATLASAAALFQGEGSACEALHFETLSGGLVVRAEPAGGTGLPLLCMDFPSAPAQAALPPDVGPASELLKCLLGGHPAGESCVEEVLYAPSLRYLLVVLRQGCQEVLVGLRPDQARLEAAHQGGQVAGIIVTAPGESGGAHDFLSRFFAPWLGVAEDPVTGSAHCVAGPYWARRLGRARLRAKQCSARGGELRVTVDGGAGRVELAGEAVVVLKGQLLLPLDGGTG